LPNLDPQLAETGKEAAMAENLFAGLTNFNSETQLVEPELAQSWSVSDDGRTWLFHLRDDISWISAAEPGEGSGDPVRVTAIRPVDAHDAVFAIQRACLAETGAPIHYTLFLVEGCQEAFLAGDDVDDPGALVSVRAVDDQTLEIRLRQPAAYLPTLLSLPFVHPVPRERVEEMGADWRNLPNDDFEDGWQTPANLITSGPFVPLLDNLTMESATLHANPLWPLPRIGNVDLVNVSFMDDEDEMLELWSDRMLDVSPLPSQEQETMLEQFPGRVKLIPEPAVFYLGFNFESTVFAVPEVRRAFSAAIDRDRLVEEMFAGRGLSLRHLSPPGIFGAPPVTEIGIGYSPDYARQQMDQSEFRSCRLMPPVTFLVSTADLSLLQAELVRRMWIEELDCTEEQVVIEQVEFGELLKRTARDNNGGRPDIWELAWPSVVPDAHGILSELLACADGENRQSRPCGQVDQLLRQAATTNDMARRIDLYRQAENQFFGDGGIAPVIPLFIRGEHVLVQSWLEFEPALLGGEQFDRYLVEADLKRLERSR
jgi:oligopeptide transport system substrate-binding protein